MPHVIVKMWPGRSEQQKKQLTEAIVKDVMDALGAEEKWISVAIEDVPQKDWAEKVYKPEIQKNLQMLYRKPDYTLKDL